MSVKNFQFNLYPTIEHSIRSKTLFEFQCDLFVKRLQVRLIFFSNVFQIIPIEKLNLFILNCPWTRLKSIRNLLNHLNPNLFSNLHPFLQLFPYFWTFYCYFSRRNISCAFFPLAGNEKAKWIYLSSMHIFCSLPVPTFVWKSISIQTCIE